MPLAMILRGAGPLLRGAAEMARHLPISRAGFRETLTALVVFLLKACIDYLVKKLVSDFARRRGFSEKQIWVAVFLAKPFINFLLEKLLSLLAPRGRRDAQGDGAGDGANGHAMALMPLPNAPV